MIQVFDIDNMKRLPSLKIETVEGFYKEMRGKGYGVLVDRDGDVCVSKEDPDDDGLSYAEQIQELENLK